MTGAVLGVAGVVAGLLLLRRSLRTRPVPIGQLLGVVAPAPVSFGIRPQTWKAAAGNYWLGRFESSPLDTPRLRSDLAVTGWSAQQLIGETVVGACASALVVPVGSLLLDAAGVTVPFALPAIAALGMALAGGLVPYVTLKKKAEEARRRFRRALATFLELVSLAMAGAMGIEGALDGVAALSDDPAFTLISARIHQARVAGLPPWHALGALGEEIGVAELTEVSTNLALAGSEGAKVRDTLSSKAGTLRRREMADAESEANATTEKMFLPGVLLLTGFMIFVGYPAVAHVFHNL